MPFIHHYSLAPPLSLPKQDKCTQQEGLQHAVQGTSECKQAYLLALEEVQLCI